MSFIELFLKGDVLEEEIDQFVEDWHEGRKGADMELHDEGHAVNKALLALVKKRLANPQRIRVSLNDL